jgi:hypothetical protein
MVTIAADPKHLGARLAITSVHTWGSAMTRQLHVHMIVPGGGIGLDGSKWIAKRPAFLPPVITMLTRSACTLEDLSAICGERFGKRIHPWSVGRLLRRPGLSRQKTRPGHPMKDPAAAAASKKSPASAAEKSAYA